jgi:tellurite resistance protein TerC
MHSEFLIFGFFALFITIMLSLDLGIFHKKDKVVSLSQAAIMSAIWVSCAMVFYLFLRYYGYKLHDINNMTTLVEVVKNYKHQITLIPNNFDKSIDIYNHNLSLEFITGYIVEYALSVDNIFVMVLIFSAFKVNEKYYHRVLFWGILGAVILRFAFIFLGASLINNFGWILYLFGAFLIYSGVMLLINNEEENTIDPENHKVVKFASKYFLVWPEFLGNRFFTKQNGKKYITPLFLVLLIVEFSDVIFAVDSIPAIFAITKDAYIVFFSNIFAILGLRSMFFLLVNIIHKFHFLQLGLAILLIFIGAKMLGEHWLKEWGFTTAQSLYVILGILIVSIIASLIFPKKLEVNSI